LAVPASPGPAFEAIELTERSIALFRDGRLDVLDPTDGGVSMGTNVSTLQSVAATLRLPDGRILVIGQDKGLLVDPASLGVSVINLLQGRNGCNALLMPSSVVLLMGGRLFNLSPTNSTELVDLGPWRIAGRNVSPRPMRSAHAVLLPSDEVLLVAQTDEGPSWALFRGLRQVSSADDPHLPSAP
jgi:hypothetical protein